MIFTDRVLQLISENKITKNKLLSDLNLSKNSFVDWGKRGNIPNGETLARIADYLGCSVDYLLGRDKYAAQPNEPQIKKAPIQEDEGIRLYNQLDAEDKAEIRGEIKHMLKAEKYAKDIGTKMA